MSSTTLQLFRADGRTSLARLLARHTQVKRYLAHAEMRASEGNRFCPAIADYYRAELAELDRLVAKKQQRKDKIVTHKKKGSK